MPTYRLRLGVRLDLPFGMFKNAGIFVFPKAPEEVRSKVLGAFSTLQAWAASQSDPRIKELAGRLVFEAVQDSA